MLSGAIGGYDGIVRSLKRSVGKYFADAMRVMGMFMIIIAMPVVKLALLKIILKISSAKTN